MIHHRPLLVLTLVTAALAGACSGSDTKVSIPPGERRAELREVRGNVVVTRGAETLPGKAGLKLEPDDILVVDKLSIALFECSHGVAGKLGPAASAPVKNLVCFEAPPSGTYEQQVEYLLAPGDRDLLASGERVAAIDARLKAATGGSSSSQERVDESQLDSAGGATEGDAVSEVEEARPVVAAKTDAPAKTKPKAPPAPPEPELARGSTSNLAKLRDQESDSLRASGASSPSTPGGGAGPAAGDRAIPEAKKGRPFTTPSIVASDESADSAIRQIVPGLDGGRSNGVVGRPAVTPKPASPLPSMVYNDKALRQCALGMLAKGQSELRLVITVKNGAIVDVRRVTGQSRADACLKSGLKKASAKEIPDGEHTVVLKRKLLEKS